MDTETFTCSGCGDTFPSRVELDAHSHSMPLAWERGSTPFECGECGISFDEADELITHQASAHAGDAQVQQEI